MAELEPVDVLVCDHVEEPQEQKQDRDIGSPIRTVPFSHRRHTEHRSFHYATPRWTTVVVSPQGPPTPPPELHSVWESRAQLVSVRQRHQRRLGDDARQKGVHLLSFELTDNRRKWEDHFYHLKEDFHASESRRLRLVCDDLSLQRKMCELSAPHKETNWICYNCGNLDSQSYALAI